MKLRFSAIALPLVLLAPEASQAQVSADVAKITCEQFILFALWLSGYYNAKRNNTVIDPQALEQNTDKVKQYCTTNLKVTVMQAVEATLGENK